MASPPFNPHVSIHISLTVEFKAALKYKEALNRPVPEQRVTIQHLVTWVATRTYMELPEANASVV